MTKAPFEELSIDTIGPLKEDGQGFKYILCLTDSFSRFVELIPTKDCTAKTAAHGLLSVFARYGAPKSIRTDQGVQFTATVIKLLLEVLGVQHTVTAAYHPEANGICERSHQETLRHLRALLAVTGKDANWSSLLPLVQRVQNDTFCRAIGMTPTELLFGKMVSPLRFIARTANDTTPQTKVAVDYVTGLCDIQSQLLKASQTTFQEYVKENVARHPTNIRKFSEGQYVLIENGSTKEHKLQLPWVGPFIVVEKVSDALYKCQNLRDKKVETYAAARLKRCWLAVDDDPVVHAGMDKHEYPVEAIVDHYSSGPTKASFWFQVRWKNYGPADDHWMPYKEIKDLEALARYLEAHPDVHLPRK